MDHSSVSTLIVEDCPDVRYLLEVLLGALCGIHGANAVGDAETALDALALAVDAPDLIVLDVDLPGMSGLQALRRLRATAPDAAVLVVSGQADPVVAREIASVHGAAFLPKPCLVSHMADVVDRLLSASSPPRFAAA